MGAIEERDDDDIDRPSGDENSQNKADRADNDDNDDDANLQVEVSILDLDRDGSINLDRDSEDDGKTTKLLAGQRGNSGDIAEIVASETNFFKTITDSMPVLADISNGGDNEDNSY